MVIDKSPLVREPGNAQNGAYRPPGSPRSAEPQPAANCHGETGSKNQDKRSEAGRQAQHGGVSGQGHPSLLAPSLRRAVRLLREITSVKVVEKRVSEEVAKGQAAMGGSFAGSASISGGVSSAIPSTCM